MESFDLTTDIQPVTEFRAKTSEIIEDLKKNRRTIILTQHGRPAAVLESVEEYQRKQEELRFLTGLVAGMRDLDAGSVVNGEKFFQSLKNRVDDGK
ncbi:type II toxin-antitoxin system Phd/YefM family antitoxin [Desulfotomaculum copahuensis]|uniref:Antitoxin n=1 Tax=Desulfotomaculum copahuensis TaxID=1838280 RepID=A0A1B7LFB8_9FIRM|nr:type II toxin-antitoxin system Phd/YefM family antitoxin [Desulfotomaculum copahuensis]OAT82351.1 hypothetical protein A6M21_09405 [Desulfotomaculum copahuensis]